jgi:hypothetical protein
VDPGYGVPLPPVTSHPIAPTPGHPIVIPPTYQSNELPDSGNRPDNSLPTPPNVWPKPPVGIWPPPQPIYPSHPIYPGGRPSHPIAPGGGGGEKPEHPIAPGGGPEHPIELPPGSVWPPLPPEIKGKILAFCWLVGIGYRWVVIDPSLKPDIGLPGDQPGIDNTLPGSGNRPSNELPPHAQPKRG